MKTGEIDAVVRKKVEGSSLSVEAIQTMGKSG